MSSPLETARAEVARLEKEQLLADALDAAGAAHTADPTDENYAAHNRAAEALASHRMESRQGRQGLVGGDAYVQGNSINETVKVEE